MASIRVDGVRLVVYPNDHPPPHVHALGAGWEIKVTLSYPPNLLSICGEPKKQEVANVLCSVANELSVLRTMWGELHD